MIEFTRLPGTLLVSNRPTDYADTLHARVRFSVDDGPDVDFTGGTGAYLPVEDDHFEDDGRLVYYPHHDETVAQIAVDSPGDELVVHREDVDLAVARVGDELFVRSQISPTAYSPTYFVVTDALYRIDDALMFEPDDPDPAPADHFLGLHEPVDDPVRLTNVETGRTQPVSRARVTSLVDDPRPNGALPISEPDAPLDSLSRLI